MKEIFINVDAYNSDGIKTIQGNNNAEVYKIYVLFNKRRIDLNGKTVKMAYLRTGTVEGDVINLEVTNAQEGEITLQITNAISKKDGVYSCQLAICDAVSGFKEHTATFGLTVEANIFNKIADEIADNKDLTYIERILEEAINTSEELKSNIPVARQLNIDLENQNRILNENMDRANGVNNTLINTTEQSKVAATDAIEKKSQLESSIVKAKEFIDGLDGSQNIPQIRLDVTELQNGLKSNQALSYEGSSISAENTLEGRTEGMRIKGKTLLNIHSKSNYSFATSIPQENYTLSEGQNFCEVTIKKYPSSSYYYINAGTINFDLLKPNQKYTLLAKATDGLYPSVMTGGYEFPLTSSGTSFKNGVATMTTNNLVNGSKGQILYINLNGGATYKQELRDVMIFEGDLSIIPCSYFEGIKSFGEAEQEGDKYKISILSHGKNILNPSLKEVNIYYGYANGLKISQNGTTSYSGIVEPNQKYVVSNNKGQVSNFTFWDKDNNFISGIAVTMKFTTPHNAITLKCACDNDALVQIEKGNISTPYQPYKQDKKDILISAPLRSVDDVKDIMYEDNGQVKVYRKLGKYTFTGEEAITKENTLTNITRFYIDIPCKNIINTRNIICNNFNSNGTWWDRDEIGMYWDTSIQGRLWFHIKNGEFNDFEAFRNFLKANKTTIVYQLDKPVIEVIENCIDIDLDTYESITYVNTLNSLPGELDFKVPSNIGSSLQNLAKEVNNIWDVINNLLVPGLIDVNKIVAMATIKNNLQ